MSEAAVTVSERGSQPPSTAETVLRIVGEVLRKDGIGLDDDLFSIGATSLSFVRVLAQVNETFDVTVHATELADGVTVRRFAAAVDAASAHAETQGA